MGCLGPGLCHLRAFHRDADPGLLRNPERGHPGVEREQALHGLYLHPAEIQPGQVPGPAQHHPDPQGAEGLRPPRRADEMDAEPRPDRPGHARAALDARRDGDRGRKDRRHLLRRGGQLLRSEGLEGKRRHPQEHGHLRQHHPGREHLPGPRHLLRDEDGAALHGSQLRDPRHDDRRVRGNGRGVEPEAARAEHHRHPQLHAGRMDLAKPALAGHALHLPGFGGDRGRGRLPGRLHRPDLLHGFRPRAEAHGLRARAKAALQGDHLLGWARSSTARSPTT